MATRKEEKERLRAARLEAERLEALGARKRLILGYGAAGQGSIPPNSDLVFEVKLADVG